MKDIDLQSEIEKLLTANPEARKQENIKRVIWRMWLLCGAANEHGMLKEDFLMAPAPTTIVKERRDIMKRHDEGLKIHKRCFCGCNTLWRDPKAQEQAEAVRVKYSPKTSPRASQSVSQPVESGSHEDKMAAMRAAYALARPNQINKENI